MRRHLVRLILAALAAGSFAAGGFVGGGAAAAAEPGGEAMRASLEAAFEAGELDALHSVLVLRNGEVFAEAYFNGEDERWGAPTGLRRHGPDELHDLRSVSKSVTAILYGIALERGLVPELDASLVAAFPEYEDLAADPERRRITVRDALTMRMGLEWDEDRPYTDARNSEVAMEMAADRCRFALSRPIVGPPGGEWTYSGGATALIAGLIERGTGLPLGDFAAEALFGPLGIERFEWIEGADGRAVAASGLRLTPPDLARIGLMVLNGGAFDGRRVVPAGWIAEMTAPQGGDLPNGLRYGFFWWLAPGEGAARWAAGFGNGGQRLSVSPALGLVTVIFAGRYNDMEAWRLPVAVIEDHLVPALGLR